MLTLNVVKFLIKLKTILRKQDNYEVVEHSYVENSLDIMKQQW